MNAPAFSALPSGIHFLDVRPLQSPSGPPKAGPLVTIRGVPTLLERAVADVDTLMLHQTACTFDVAKYQIRAAGGDALLAQFLRSRDVHAHVTAFDEGTFAIAYKLRSYLWHANGGSKRSIGLEMEGLFHGQPGGKDNAPMPTERGEPTDLLIETSRAACTRIVEEWSAEGGELRYYEPHRLHSKDRRSDPGWKLYQTVGIDHCEKKLGLKPRLGREFTTRDGMPVPNVWDPRSTFPY